MFLNFFPCVYNLVKFMFLKKIRGHFFEYPAIMMRGSKKNQKTNGPVNAHLISWTYKAQSIQSQENIW